MLVGVTSRGNRWENASGPQHIPELDLQFRVNGVHRDPRRAFAVDGDPRGQVYVAERTAAPAVPPVLTRQMLIRDAWYAHASAG
jgi:hypothetical protein